MNPNIVNYSSKVGFDVADYIWFDATLNKETEKEVYQWGKDFLPNWDAPTSLDEYYAPFSKMAFVHKDFNYIFTYEKDNPSLCVWDSTKRKEPIVEIVQSEGDGLEAICIPEILTGKTEQENYEIEAYYVNMAQSLLHLVCIINLRAHRLDFIVEGHQAKNNKAINAKRLRKNKSLIFLWNTIQLRPQPNRMPQKGDGSHASPARHKRRGHLRRRTDGTFKWINEMWVGKIQNGVIVHDYMASEKIMDKTYE